MRITVLFSVLLFISIDVFAQKVLIPKDFVLEDASDYKEAEPYVLNCINWSQNNPVAKDPGKRKKINTFVLQWITGSPSVSIELVEGLYPANCPDCLMAFMAGWVKYSLENDYSKDKIKCAVAGVGHTIEFYEKNKSSLGKSSDLEKMKKQKKKGKLVEYVKGLF